MAKEYLELNQRSDWSDKKISTIPHPSHLNFSNIQPLENTTEGPVVQGSASRVLGGRDEGRSQSTKNERWMPSVIKRDALPPNINDAKFRKVRGILNKLTPQTFDKLSNEIIYVGLDSQILLQGVILLIFDKALQEPKYASMYAQLCKRLSNKVPNFDDHNPDGTTTFLRLLLRKCEDEYTNRANLSVHYEKKVGRLTADEEEDFHLAKRKMLGNIKFICELGKLEMVTCSILHTCCEELVKKTSPEDLECLCQIMMTCGPLLDKNRGNLLMDQYFHRMREYSQCDKFPPRIRFMLQDVLELRENNWLPRQVSAKENPKPINEIRLEASDELGISEPFRNLARDFNQSFEHKKSLRAMGLAQKKKSGMGDLFAHPGMPMGSLGTGPGVINIGDNVQRNDTNGHNHSGPPYRGGGGMRNFNNHNGVSQNGDAYNKTGAQFTPNDDYKRSQKLNMRYRQMMMMSNGHEKPPLAPRFMQKNQMQKPGGMSGMQSNQHMNMTSEELSFRPAFRSLLANVPGAPVDRPVNNINTLKNSNRLMMNHPANPILSTLPSPKESPVPLPKMSIDKLKQKKEKGPSKEDLVQRLETISGEYSQNKNENELIQAIKELNIPERLICPAVTAVLNKAMDKNESERDDIGNVIVLMVTKGIVTNTQFLESFRSVIDMMSELEADIPRIKSYVAAFAAKAISEDIISLPDIAESTENGNNYPFLLLVLQQMSKCMDKSKICKLFTESKIHMLSTLPKSDRTKDRMAEILEERELSYLFPLLKIQSQMMKQLSVSAKPSDFLVWINGNIDATYHTSHGFIAALMTAVFKFIASEIPNNEQTNEKFVKEKEKELLTDFKPVLSTFLRGHKELQVIAIYAVQAAWYSLGCPRVMLLRWFMNLYELDIMDDDAFLAWKEDIKHDYPGKGQALFQVNQWFVYLEEEEEDDYDEDEVEN